nr:hypothetical protein BaRGS_027553 [Batillaria attramentaria]
MKQSQSWPRQLHLLPDQSLKSLRNVWNLPHTMLMDLLTLTALVAGTGGEEAAEEPAAVDLNAMFYACSLCSYRCQICKTAFDRQQDLMAHLQENSQTLFGCSRCSARFLTKDAIKQHCQIEHSGTRAYRVVKMVLCLDRKQNNYQPPTLDGLEVGDVTAEVPDREVPEKSLENDEKLWNLLGTAELHQAMRGYCERTAVSRKTIRRHLSQEHGGSSKVTTDGYSPSEDKENKAGSKGEGPEPSTSDSPDKDKETLYT